MAQETSESKSGLAISGPKNPYASRVGNFSLEAVTRRGSQMAPGLSAIRKLHDSCRKIPITLIIPADQWVNLFS
jgi:hypothetical protein